MVERRAGQVLVVVGAPLAFLIVLCGLLAALLAHALAEDREDRGTLTRVAATYLVAGGAGLLAGLWPVALVLVGGGLATVLLFRGWEGGAAAAAAASAGA